MVSCGFRMKSKLGDPCRDCSLNNVSIQRRQAEGKRKKRGREHRSLFPLRRQGPCALVNTPGWMRGSNYLGKRLPQQSEKHRSDGEYHSAHNIDIREPAPRHRLLGQHRRPR